jgi:diguanylate cyclase (GGDEF)-like protein
VQCNIRDITERKRFERQLRFDALHDGLTGLANRAFFTEYLQKNIERTKRDHKDLFAVLFLDFDRFKVVNDSFGHTEGDNLLKQIARRLESTLRSGDLVARLGGDEFTILVNNLNEPSDASLIAEHIQSTLEIPFEIGGSKIFISASIGISLSTIGYVKAEEMLRDADIAMYRAKAKGKAQYQVFDQTMREQALSQMRTETEMHQAIERDEFLVYYQPILNIQTETLLDLRPWCDGNTKLTAYFHRFNLSEQQRIPVYFAARKMGSARKLSATAALAEKISGRFRTDSER